jgi:hypothetical protein
MQFSEFHAVAYTFFSLFIVVVLIIFSWMKKSILECVPDLAKIAEILTKHHEVEERDEKIAALLKMTPDQLKIELQQRDRLELIGEKAAIVAARLKATFPLNYRK